MKENKEMDENKEMKGNAGGLEILERLCEAAKYQKMAVQALFPEKTAEHLEVIEGELKAMAFEIIEEAMMKKSKMEKEENNKGRPASSKGANKIEVE